MTSRSILARSMSIEVGQSSQAAIDAFEKLGGSVPAAASDGFGQNHQTSINPVQARESVWSYVRGEWVSAHSIIDLISGELAMRALLILSALLVAGSFHSTPAAAKTYPFCARSGIDECAFDTLQQCKDSIAGKGDFCIANPFYQGPDHAQYTPRRKSPRR